MAADVSSLRTTKKKLSTRSPQPDENDDGIPMSTLSSSGKTDLHEIMRQALVQNENETGKKKKKKAAADTLLESLRRGDGIKKDEEDRLLKSNTYDPDNDAKSGKSNRQRDAAKRQQQQQQDGYDNEAYEMEKLTVPKKSVKKKSTLSENSEGGTDVKKPMRDSTNNKNNNNNSDDNSQPAKRTVKKTDQDLPAVHSTKKRSASPAGKRDLPSRALSPGMSSAYESDEQQLGSGTDSKKPPVRRKKKVTKTVTSDEDRGTEEESAVDSTVEREGTSAAESGGEGTEGGKPRKAATRKKKKKKLEKVTEEAAPPPDDGRILAIRIHRTDKLRTEIFILHPVVRVHLVDTDTGQYLKKTSRVSNAVAESGRPAANYYEGDNVDSLLPIITQPFDFKEERSMLPVWEEVLIYNDSYQHFVDPTTKVIMFFEVLDTVSMNRAARQNNRRQQPQQDTTGGYYRIAWAFLKLVGGGTAPNVDKKLRLQLFQPPANFHASGSQVEVFEWWKSAPRINYPSTLYVTVKGILPPPNLSHAARSMSALQQEQGLMAYDDMERNYEAGTSNQSVRKSRLPNWARLPGQRCRLPNAVSLALPGGQKGCFTVKFSPDGKMLACGCHDRDGFPIYVYDMPNGKLKAELFGHCALVYEVSWSPDSQRLVTASSDGTARIWEVEQVPGSAYKTLPHPAFVYSAKFHPTVHTVLATSCFDRIIRIWSLESNEPSQAELVQEIDGHESMVNSLCFAKDGHQLFSADAAGTIRVWNVHVTDQPSKKGVLSDWTLNKEVKDPELKGVCISHVVTHPSGNRLLVHTRDNIIRLFDLRMYSIVHRLMGALNFRERIASTFSPCGSFVISGSEDSCAYVWNCDTGDQVAMYSSLGLKNTVCGVDFHPMDNYAAFCSFGPQRPVLVYKYDTSVAQQEAGVALGGDGGLMSTRQPPPSPLKTFSTIEVGEASKDGMESSIGRVARMHDELDKHKYSRLQRVTMTLNHASAFINASHQQSMNGDLPLDSTSRASMLMGDWTPQASARQRADQHHIEPSVLSPHARVSLKQIVQQQQLLTYGKSQRLSGGLDSGGWTPAFNPVGSKRPVMPAGGGEVVLDMSSGKPQVSVQGARKKGADVEQVVALYDYKAQRSDELDLQRGDVIVVLHKDNATWWMGQQLTGRQGYFMANYVATYTAGDEGQGHDVDSVAAATSDEDTGVRKSLTAVRTKEGDLKFISGAEDTDDDDKSKSRSRRSQQLVTFVDEGSAAGPSKGQGRKVTKSKPQSAESDA